MDSYAPVNKRGIPHLHVKGETASLASQVDHHVKVMGETNANTEAAGPVFNPAHHNVKKQTVDLGKAGSFTVRKGALHRALGVPEGQKIPASKLAAASKSKNPKVRRMAASAKGFAKMRHK